MIVFIVIFFSIFLIWSYSMYKGKFKNIDSIVYNKLKIKEPYISILKLITNLASTKYFVLVCILLLIFLSNKRLAIAIALLMIINSMVIGLFKNIFKRERPNIKRLVIEHGYSYPSGHTISAVSFYGFLIFLVVISSIVIPIKIVLISLLGLLILVIGFSRIYLGVHYFSDVVGGILVSLSYLLLYTYIGHFILSLF